MGFDHVDGKWMWLALLALCAPLSVAAQETAVPKEVEHHVNTATEVFESMLKTDLSISTLVTPA